MPTIEDSRQQRDQALKIWRQEVRRLSELEKWLSQQQQKAASEMRKQEAVVNQARSRYDTANDEYLNRIHRAKLAAPAPKARHAANRP